MLESLISKIPPEALAQMRDGISNPIPSDDYLKLRCKWANDVQGSLTGYDCPLCKNRGYTVEIRGNNLVTVECGCMNKRRSIRRIEKSGMAHLLKRCTFQTFRASKPWQAEMKRLAMEYATQGAGKWFAACGSVGAGKTHICTAICGELINAGFEVRYMLWLDESTKIKSVVNDDEGYEKLVWPLKNVPVLYIDDLFKGSVTDADVKLAFKILNYRGNNPKAATIVSSERSLGEIMEIDKAVGSRIVERCGDFYINLTGDKNQRLRQ